MEQQELRDWEYKCIQEEQPWCQAACPIHVDVRSFARLMASGDMQGARAVLARTMPLPGVLGLICDHPCEKPCRRGDVEETIRVGELERACIRHSRPGGRPMPLPARKANVAVLGGGMSSLTAAWDLARKGYTVALFTNEPGGTLLRLSEERLPREALDHEIETIKGLKVEFRPGLEAAPELLGGLLEEFGAVYLGLDEQSPLDPATLGLAVDDGCVRIDPLTLVSSIVGVYAGGFDEPDHFSPVSLAAQGRKASVSIDRFLQKVSPTVGRDKEGPFKTRLYTPINGVESRRAAPMADPSGYLPEEAAAEAGRCLLCDCMACVHVCPYLERFKGYPRKYAREIYNNLSVVHGIRQSNTLINSCSWCHLCATICPNDFDMALLTGNARREMVRTGKMPPSAHGFALEDFAFNTSERFRLARAETGPVSGQGSCAHLFFPGCQLAGASPDHVLLAYKFLRERLGPEGGTGLMLHCCGAPAAWAGRDDLLGESTAWLREQWERLGRPRLILACPTCQITLDAELPEAEKVSLWEVLEQTGLPEGAGADGEVRMLHDPCSTCHLPGVRQSVRRLVTRLGLKIEEGELTGGLTECCGWGGLMDAANPDMGREQALRRANRSDRGHILAYCAMCRDELSGSGKSVAHLLDFLFPSSPDAVQPVAAHPLVRKGLGLADRHENREHLKRRLLHDVWKEEAVVEPWETIHLVFSPEARDVVDSRRILAEDLRRAIHAAEASGRRLTRPDTGRFIVHHTPGAVTFWVEYEPVPDGGFLVHRAWSHRMVLEVA